MMQKYPIDFPTNLSSNKGMLTNGDLQKISGIVNGAVKNSEVRLRSEIKKVQKDVAYTRSFLDKQDIRNERRIARIEQKLQIQAV